MASVGHVSRSFFARSYPQFPHISAEGQHFSTGAGGAVQGVQAALIDDGHVGVATISVGVHDGILVLFIDMAGKRIPWIAVPQRLGHVLAHQPRYGVKTSQNGGFG